jgi:hypothetical protein
MFEKRFKYGGNLTVTNNLLLVNPDILGVISEEREVITSLGINQKNKGLNNISQSESFWESNLFPKDFLFCDGAANAGKIQTKQGSIINNNLKFN